MDAAEFTEELEKKTSLILHAKYWQKCSAESLEKLFESLLTPQPQELDTEQLPEDFSSTSRKDSSLLEISALSGLDTSLWVELRNVPWKELTLIEIYLHSCGLEDISQDLKHLDDEIKKLSEEMNNE